MGMQTLHSADVASVGEVVLSPEALAAWYDRIYREADSDCARVAWQRDRVKPSPNPAMVAWLNVEASALVRPGSRACVVGCGLGDDAAELCSRGYDVMGFDVSPAAIEWAKQRHPGLSDRFVVTDVMDVPARMLRRFDLVVEVNTVDSVPPSLRERAVSGIVSLARPHGTVLVVCEGRSNDDSLDESGPTYPLSCEELTTLFSASGMHPTREIDDFQDDGDPPVRRLRGVFRH